VPGRQPKLSGEQMRRLYTLIAGTDPRQLEFGFALWTRDMLRTLIRREFRVSLSAVNVGRLLRTLGLSPQRPLWRAWQADPDAVQRWRDATRTSRRSARRARPRVSMAMAKSPLMVRCRSPLVAR
jgi:transposase